MSLLLPDEAAVRALGARLAARLRAGDVITLSGDLGAGKTTLARGILEGLGQQGDIPSPTFNIVQTYAPPELSLPVWHVDLYRLSDPQEIHELGLGEALDEGALLIEWPDRLDGLFADRALALHLEDAGARGRRLTASVPPAWEGRWPFP